MGLAPAASSSGWVSRGHRAIAPFHAHRPGTVDEAVALLAGADGAWAMAGGIDVVARLRDGVVASDVVCIDGIAELGTIERADGTLRIGAAVTHRRIETDATIAGARPDLAAAWRTVGNVRVRLAGTLGGNVMAFQPNYDGPVLLAAAGARLLFRAADGDHAVDPAAAPGWSPPPRALLTAAEIPLDGARMLFDRSLKPAVSVAVSAGPAAGGRAVRIAVGCAYARPAVVETVAADGDDPAAIAAAAVSRLPAPLGDAIASADYRRRMTEVLARRLLAELLNRKGGS